MFIRSFGKALKWFHKFVQTTFQSRRALDQQS